MSLQPSGGSIPSPSKIFAGCGSFAAPWAVFYGRRSTDVDNYEPPHIGFTQVHAEKCESNSRVPVFPCQKALPERLELCFIGLPQSSVGQKAPLPEGQICAT